MEGTAPAGIGEKVPDNMSDEADALAEGGLVHLVGWGLERPVDKHGAAEDVVARNKTPVAAVGMLCMRLSPMAKIMPGGGTTRSSPWMRVAEVERPGSGEAIVGGGGTLGERT